ncbi:uncharacterized protein RSE6_09391 [Rhynchosporium secalis]|uniref:Uncharacterized protein n=1 Tax=Rhynchosporium secalis TaxID=38038 RepID=A0A1E1MHS4_RHYSE|nr:uncharacterized protein RSE6_09391 [Rhynchosporium secalis]
MLPDSMQPRKSWASQILRLMARASKFHCRRISRIQALLTRLKQLRHQKGWDELEYEAEEMIKRALDQQSLQIYEQCPVLTQHKLDKPESKENAADADSHSTNEPGDGPAQHRFTAQVSSSPQQTPNLTRLTEAPRSNRTPIPQATPHINTDVNIAISTSILIKVQDSILDRHTHTPPYVEESWSTCPRPLFEVSLSVFLTSLSTSMKTRRSDSDYQHGKTYLPDANQRHDIFRCKGCRG